MSPPTMYWQFECSVHIFRGQLFIHISQNKMKVGTIWCSSVVNAFAYKIKFYFVDSLKHLQSRPVSFNYATVHSKLRWTFTLADTLVKQKEKNTSTSKAALFFESKISPTLWAPNMYDRMLCTLNLDIMALNSHAL